MIDPTATIHTTVDLEPDVSIGPGTHVWHRAQIRSGVHIGRNAVVGRDVFIDVDVALGDRVKVQNGALIYHGVAVGDDVFIGPGAILTNDRRPRATNAAGALARASDWTVSPIRIGNGASIGAGAVVVAGADVGPYALVGAGAIVTRDVPRHALVVGNPARVVGWVCVCAEPLLESTGARATASPASGDPDLICSACDRRFAVARDDEGLRERTADADKHGALA